MSELIPKGDREALVNLLTRLAQLDPALCQLSGHDIYTIASRGICADFTYSHSGAYIYERELVLAWVQYAVQQAIVARGWGYEIHSNRFVENNGPKVRCHIEKNTGLVYDNTFYFTPAEALLSAYVRALEAESVRGEGA